MIDMVKRGLPEAPPTKKKFNLEEFVEKYDCLLTFIFLYCVPVAICILTFRHVNHCEGCAVGYGTITAVPEFWMTVIPGVNCLIAVINMFIVLINHLHIPDIFGALCKFIFM